MVEPSLSKRESARAAELVLDSPLIELATPSVFSSAGDKKLHPSQSPTTPNLSLSTVFLDISELNYPKNCFRLIAYLGRLFFTE
jgi:hypothetical protein